MYGGIQWVVNVDECTGVGMASQWRNECQISNRCRSEIRLWDQYWLSVKAVNVGSGVGLCCRSDWGIVLDWRCSYHSSFFSAVLIACLLWVLVESRWEESGEMCCALGRMCGSSAREHRRIVPHYIFVINGFVLLMAWDSWCVLTHVLIWKGGFDHINIVLEPIIIVLDSPTTITPAHLPPFYDTPARTTIEATLHYEQHLRHQTGAHHSTHKLKNTTQSHTNTTFNIEQRCTENITWNSSNPWATLQRTHHYEPEFITTQRRSSFKHHSAAHKPTIYNRLKPSLLEGSQDGYLRR